MKEEQDYITLYCCRGRRRVMRLMVERETAVEAR